MYLNGVNRASSTLSRKPNDMTSATMLPYSPVNASCPMKSEMDSDPKLKTSAHSGSKTVSDPEMMSAPAVIIRNPMIALNVPLNTWLVVFFCTSNPIRTMVPMRMAGCPKILVAIHMTTSVIVFMISQPLWLLIYVLLYGFIYFFHIEKAVDNNDFGSMFFQTFRYFVTCEDVIGIHTGSGREVSVLNICLI